MRTQEERAADWQVIQAMKHFGEGFVKALHVLYLLADRDNAERIRKAWPEYWEEYADLARRQREESGRDWWNK